MKYDINNKENSLDDHQNGEEGGGGGDQVANACVQCFKVCFRKKAKLGLEDLFWLSFLILIVILSIVKSCTRIGWSQFLYVIVGSVICLIVVYISASIVNKLCFDDANTAHWNAHARFTQAAMAQRLQQEEHKMHVIAPPRMGGAKLNIFYTVGDVPIVVPTRGLPTSIPTPVTAQPTQQPAQPIGVIAAAAIIDSNNSTPSTCSPGIVGDSDVSCGGAIGVGVVSAAHNINTNNNNSHNNNNHNRNSGTTAPGGAVPATASAITTINTTTTTTTNYCAAPGGGHPPEQQQHNPPSYAKTSETLYEEYEKY
ncbi:uncharacterized protein LOC128964375 [Oppia nitens]|uniref:uncharacterized protein LOC128964375 n=1 Tax=Oppia nitens TaxID=1686743 RepID=UPI0023DB3802|nr:uncharacterized protein LOC128964375 [Oppia nitens]